MSNQTGSTRRAFLKSAAGVAFLSSLPAASWARLSGAGDRLRLGIIGTGGQGTYHVDHFLKMADAQNIAITKVCDVYRKRLNNAIRMIGGSASSGVMEYERILDDKDIDAVLIATPDHWHTKIAIEAMEAGKDVYVEKPLSLTIEQALACRDAVRRTGRVLQVGPQRTSEERWWKANEAIKAGRIGKVVWSQGSYCRNSREGQFNWKIDPEAGPQNKPDTDGYIDWDRWLGWKWGLAEKIPYNADRFFRFRKYYAYNGGVATDLMYHWLSPLLIAISGANGEYPRKVQTAGGQYIEKDGRDIADTMLLTVDYPSEHTVFIASVMVNDVGVEEMIRGQHATMRPDGTGWKLTEQGVWAPEFRKANGIEMKKVKNEKGEERMDPAAGEATSQISAEQGVDHSVNWLNAIRKKGTVNCNIELGTAVMVAIKMGVESYRQGKTFLWDAKAEKMVSA